MCSTSLDHFPVEAARLVLDGGADAEVSRIVAGQPDVEHGLCVGTGGGGVPLPRLEETFGVRTVKVQGDRVPARRPGGGGDRPRVAHGERGGARGGVVGSGWGRGAGIAVWEMNFEVP